MYSEDSCACCNSNVLTTFKAPNGKEYCAECMRKVYPPYLTFLIFKAPAYNIWNIEMNKYEKFIKRIDNIEWCGWHIRMRQILPSGAELVRMEFLSDKIKCGRCTEYEWTLTGNRCMSVACEEYQFKVPEKERVYPKEASIYLDWKYPKC